MKGMHVYASLGAGMSDLLSLKWQEYSLVAVIFPKKERRSSLVAFAFLSRSSLLPAGTNCITPMTALVEASPSLRSVPPPYPNHIHLDLLKHQLLGDFLTFLSLEHCYLSVPLTFPLRISYGGYLRRSPIS